MSANFKQRRQPATIMSPRDRERLSKELRQLQARMNGQLVIPTHKRATDAGLTDRKKGYYEQFLWRDVKEEDKYLRVRYERVKKALARGEAPNLSRKDRVSREAQMKADEEFLKKNMTPRTLYYAKPQTPEFEQGKKACAVEMSPQVQRIKDRYVQNRRALDPDNADRNIVERLRPTS
jgi:hypothetical protein